MDVVIRQKAVYIGASHVLLIQVEHGNVRVVLKDHAGDNLIAYLQILAGAVFLHVLSHLYDLAGSFMSQNQRDKPEGITLEFVGVCAADPAPFYFNKNIVVPDIRNRIFLDIIML